VSNGHSPRHQTNVCAHVCHGNAHGILAIASLTSKGLSKPYQSDILIMCMVSFVLRNSSRLRSRSPDRNHCALPFGLRKHETKPDGSWLRTNDAKTESWRPVRCAGLGELNRTRTARLASTALTHCIRASLARAASTGRLSGCRVNSRWYCRPSYQLRNKC
jgi:hypothetical protein